MRLLVTGSTGLLGSEVVAAARARAHEVTGVGSRQMDVTDRAQVEATIARVAPRVVIHCAALTSVDAAEDTPERAMAVNRDGARDVARAAGAAGAVFVYVSTDYVFDGALRRPYTPADEPNPLSVYAKSKLAGEVACREAWARTLVARTSWVFGSARPNFLTSMLARAARGEAVEVVEDQVGGPSWARDVAPALLDLVELGEVSGVWHVSNQGACTRADLVRHALLLSGLDAEVVGVPAREWGAAATRPAYSALDVRATEERLGRPMPTWQDALARFLRADVGAGARIP